MKVIVTDEESRLSKDDFHLPDRQETYSSYAHSTQHASGFKRSLLSQCLYGMEQRTAESWTYYTDAPLGKHHRKGVCQVYMSVQRIKAVWQDGRTNVLHNVGQGDSVDMSEGKEKDTVHSDMYMQWNILKDNHNNYPLQPPPTKNSKCNENKLVETFVQRSI